MPDETAILNDPAFKVLLKRRSHWRWGLSASLVGSYIAYVLAGIYIPDVYAVPFAGSSVPWGVVLGYLIIAASIVMSVVYVRVVNKLKEFHQDAQESGE